MTKPTQFQFTLTNETVIKKLKAIPGKFRSLCTEMAFDAWFSEEQENGGNTINFSGLTVDKKKSALPTRFRILLSNKAIVSKLFGIHPRYRSVATELSLKAWFESQHGAKLFELITARTKPQTKVSKNVNYEIDGLKKIKNVRVQTEKISEDERSVSIALEFT